MAFFIDFCSTVAMCQYNQVRVFAAGTKKTALPVDIYDLNMKTYTVKTEPPY